MINCHALASHIIAVAHPNEGVVVILSTHTELDPSGLAKNEYSAPLSVTAQVQSLNTNDTIRLQNSYQITGEERRFFLPSDFARPVKTLDRAAARSGDFIYRPRDKNLYKIFAVANDFATVDWCEVYGAVQIEWPHEIAALLKDMLPRHDTLSMPTRRTMPQTVSDTPQITPQNERRRVL